MTGVSCQKPETLITAKWKVTDLFNKKPKTFGTATLNLSKFCPENTKRNVQSDQIL